MDAMPTSQEMSYTLKRANELITEGIEEDKKENYEEASRLYEFGAKFFHYAIKNERLRETTIQEIHKHAAVCLERSEKLKKYLQKKYKPITDTRGELLRKEDSKEEIEDISDLLKNEELQETTRQKLNKSAAVLSEKMEKLTKYRQQKYMKKPIADTSEERPSISRKEDTREEKEHLSDLLQRLNVAEKPYVKWCNVFGLDKAKETLQEAFIMPLKFPYLFTDKRQPWNSILLYGPPGTGKTLLAQALATKANSILIDLSNCLGESERLFIKLFINGRTQSRTIILIDEIDVLFKSESARRTKAELLNYMKDHRKENDGVLILATTNEPWLLDDALLKRFEKKIYTPLPNTTERLRILKFCLSETPHNLTERNLQELAEKTEGYSGDDICALVRDSLMQPIRKLKTATHFKRVNGPSSSYSNVIADNLLTPCTPGCQGAIEKSWEEIPSDRLLEPVIDMCDMLRCLARSKPTTNEYDLIRYENFQECFC